MPKGHKLNCSCGVCRAKRGDSPNCGRTGSKHPLFGKFNENHPNWKGDAVCYGALHIWIRKMKGPAKNYKCVDCGKQAHDWSNVDHKHRRRLEDYLPRCLSCHYNHDKEKGFKNYKFKN